MADAANDLLRKVDAKGNVATLAGKGGAEFSEPDGVAVDGAGNGYVADYNGRRLRKVAPGGAVATLAGSGVWGCADGTGGALGTASFGGPLGLAVDSADAVFVADPFCNAIRRVDAAGAVTTLAGGKPPDEWQNGKRAIFREPSGVAVDAAGNVYVADTLNSAIRKIDPEGNVTALAGNGIAGDADGTGGPNGTARFNQPMGVAVDAKGDGYVADWFNDRLRKIDGKGNVTTLAGDGRQGFADGTPGASGTAEFWQPTSVAVDAAGNVYLADEGNNRLRKVSP